MKNLRKMLIGVLVLAVICCASCSDIENKDEDSKDRSQRSSKVLENTSENNVKRQKTQKKKYTTQEKSQSLKNGDQIEMQEAATRVSQNNLNTANGLNGFNQNMMDFTNGPRQLEPNNPYIASGLQNYANNFPYPGQPQQNFMGYFYGNPNMSPNGPQQMGPPPKQGFNSFLSQQPGFSNGHLPFPAGYGNNLMNYGSFPNGQPGLSNYPQPALQPQGPYNFINQQGPQPGLTNPNQAYPPAYASNFLGYNPSQLTQPGLQNNFGSQPNTPHADNNFNGQQFNPANNIMGHDSFSIDRSGFSNNPNLNFGPQMENYQPQLSLQPSQLQQQQLQLNPFANGIPYGGQLQDPFNNGFMENPSFGAGAFPEYPRLQRAMKLKNKT